MTSHFAVLLAAATVGALHTVAPDHWVPFAALARANGWSAKRVTRTTILCGFGHVTVSAALALAATFVGLELVHAIGTRLESQATLLLIAFGFVYLVWGLHRSFRPHEHHHHRGSMTEWSLFLLFCADPCVAVMPLVFAAATNGWMHTISVIAAYELATIGTMVALVLAAHAGAQRLHFHWLDRYGDAVAGGVIVCVGVVVTVLGV